MCVYVKCMVCNQYGTMITTLITNVMSDHMIGHSYDKMTI